MLFIGIVSSYWQYNKKEKKRSLFSTLRLRLVLLAGFRRCFRYAIFVDHHTFFLPLTNIAHNYGR